MSPTIEEKGTISEVTRRAIFDVFEMNAVAWAGRLSEVDFLSRIYDLTTTPSNDHLFDDAAGDIHQHRVNNPQDWPDNWIFEDRRFNLLGCSTERFLEFLCETIHPVVRPDRTEAARLAGLFNEQLRHDGWELHEASFLSGRLVYGARRTYAGPVPAVRVAQALSAQYVHEQIRRMESAIEGDPSLAIGTAKELIETMCKAILEERGRGGGSGILRVEPAEENRCEESLSCSRVRSGEGSGC